MERAGSLESTANFLCFITRSCTAKSVKQLFYNIAGGIVHQIGREKQTTMS